MEIAEAIALANLALTMLEKLSGMIHLGGVNPQIQAGLISRYAALLKDAADKFNTVDSKDWTKSDGTKSGSQTP